MDEAQRKIAESGAQMDTRPAYAEAAPGALAPFLTAPGSSDNPGASADSSGPLRRSWQQELPRWLATLDSERTRREYEKAVGYFFQTPGVPGMLEDLTFDLLLAYRGSLALRAERPFTATAHRRSEPSPRHSRIEAEPPEDGLAGHLAAHSGETDTEGPPLADSNGQTGHHTSIGAPLAPATVNIRLTALRQFLAHCSLWGHLPDLPPDRMRAALRRLRIERRRPYQILAEPEWADFLRAARGPGQAYWTTKPESNKGRADEGNRHLSTDQPPQHSDDSASRAATIATTPDGTLVGSWWGTPHAERKHREDEDAGSSKHIMHTHESDAVGVAMRSPARLTGARTAQRDHALLALALATGLRAIELCSLDLGDLEREWNAGREEWWLVLPDAKTKGQHGGRTLPLAPSLAATILEYAARTGRQWARAADRATPLFLSFHFAQHESPGLGERSKRAVRGRLSPQHVRRIVDRVERQWLAAQNGSAGTDNTRGEMAPDTRSISPHALRHSTAVALLEGNERSGRAPASVEHVRGWLGHFDIRTTQGYLAHLDARRHRRPFVLEPVEEPPTTRTNATQGGMRTDKGITEDDDNPNRA